MPKAKKTVERRSNFQWTQEKDDELLGLRANGTPLIKIAEMLGIPRTTCHYHYSKLMTNAVEWDEDMDNKLRIAYQKHRDGFWEEVGRELGVPWRAAEARAWDLGKKKITLKK